MLLACWRASILAPALVLSACNFDRIAQLEKENKELKVQIDQPRQVADLDTTAKCSASAQHFFEVNYPGPYKKGTFLSQRNHYNRSLGKCFVAITYNFGSTSRYFASFVTVYDVYENQEYAQLSQDVLYEPERDPGLAPYILHQCRVAENKCQSPNEFDEYLQPLMSH
jgi:hypothetical protein